MIDEISNLQCKDIDDHDNPVPSLPIHLNAICLIVGLTLRNLKISVF